MTSLWWDPDDEGLCVWAAYQPKCASSFGASLYDLSGNGNNASDPGGSSTPDWDATNGWKIDFGEYLTTSFVPDSDQSQTVIAQFTNAVSNVGMNALFGMLEAADRTLGALYSHVTEAHRVYANGASVSVSGALSSGNMAVAGNQGYKDGASDGGSIGAWGGSVSSALYIGVINDTGTPSRYGSAYIQALAIYDCTLTAAQVAKVAAAMAAITCPAVGEAETLYASATNTTGIISVDIDQDYGQPTANAMVECESTTLELGDAIEIDIGYVGNHAIVFKGYVLEIISTRSGEKRTYTIRARDTLWRAMANFIASEDPLAPLEYSNIEAENLVKAMLDLSGISSYSLDSPGFTFAPEEPLEVNLTSAWDMISRICWLIAWHCYDDLGTVKFLDLKPYNVGDTAVHTFQVGDGGDVISVEPLAKGSDKIRNRVVVYGAEGVYASAQASSPWLPSGFYKTEVISAPDLIDNNSMAQDIADYNLNMLNRLEKGVTARVVGVPTVNARDTVAFVEAQTGASGYWFVYNCKHQLADFYMQTLTLVQRQTS